MGVQAGSAKQSSDADTLDGQAMGHVLSSAQLEKLATRMAHKSYEKNPQDDLNKVPRLRGPAKIHARIAAEEAKRGRAHQVTLATVRYAGDVTKTSLKSTSYTCTVSTSANVEQPLWHSSIMSPTASATRHRT